MIVVRLQQGSTPRKNVVIFNEACSRENCQMNVLSVHTKEVAFYVIISKQRQKQHFSTCGVHGQPISELHELLYFFPDL